MFVIGLEVFVHVLVDEQGILRHVDGQLVGMRLGTPHRLRLREGGWGPWPWTRVGARDRRWSRGGLGNGTAATRGGGEETDDETQSPKTGEKSSKHFKQNQNHGQTNILLSKEKHKTDPHGRIKWIKAEPQQRSMHERAPRTPVPSP